MLKITPFIHPVIMMIHCRVASVKFPLMFGVGVGVTGFSGCLKVSLCEGRRLKDTQNLECEDRRLQNCLVLKTEDLATKPED